MRQLLTLFDVTPSDIENIFRLSHDLKQKFGEGIREPLLSGRVIGLLFEKPSLRTRVSFETAMVHLGGGSLFLGEDVGWRNGREAASDFSAVLSEMLDAVVCRAKSHATVEELAKYATIPVVNGLTDTSHPCQALADLFTVREVHGSLQGLRVAYIGDANNVAASLAVGCAMLGVEFCIAAPKGYQFSSEFENRIKTIAPDWKLQQTTDPREAVSEAAAVYTDVWASMGQEAEHETRKKAFASFQVNEALMDNAPSDAIFLHCLPARRGEEVTDGVIDSPQSAVFRQAGNRMHVQKGLLVWLLGR